MASLAGFDHIGEKIFKFYQGKAIIVFRLVCQSWKQILDNPKYWLKKLDGIGQSKKQSKEYSVLIQKASRAGIPLTKIGFCLCIKYMKLTNSEYSKNFSEKIKALLYRLPILYFAMIPSNPDLELIRFMAKSVPNVSKPIKRTFGIKYIRGRSVTWHRDYEINPLKDAIVGNHNLEIIKCLVSQLKGKIKMESYVDAFDLALVKKDFELCKHFVEELTDTDFENFHESMFGKTVRAQNIKVFKLLIMKKKGQFAITGKWFEGSTFHVIFNRCIFLKRYSNESHQCVEMVKLMVPKLQNINDRNESNENVFNDIIHFWSDAPCMAEIMKLLAPLTDSQNYGNLIHLATIGQDLELVKEIGEKLDDFDDFFSNHSIHRHPIHDAIRFGNIDILKYLVSKSKKPYKLAKWKYSTTPLHATIQYCDQRSVKNHQCIEMAKLVIPKIEESVSFQTILEDVVKKHVEYLKKPCTIRILELILPFCEINENAKKYPAPIYKVLKPYAKKRKHNDVEFIPSKKVRSV